MQRLVLIFPVLLAALVLWALISGQDQALARLAAQMQREFQNGLADGLRALRSGEAGAMATLLGLCFAYGFFHAVGPGHGKVLIGGYGLVSKVPLLRLSAISMLSSLGQAVSAIALVLAGTSLLGWTRTQLTGTAETLLQPISAIAIGLIGAWLALRGGLRARKSWSVGRRDAHGIAECGHRHGPTAEEIQQSTGFREAIALIASIALRPCSGAILLLVLTWYMDILMAGILGTLAMSAGTAALTILVAVLSVSARESTILSLGETRSAAIALPLVEVLMGALIVLVALRMIA